MAADEPIQPERSAIERLMAECRPRLVVLAAAILGDRHEAEDVVQETSVAVWRRAAEIDTAKLPAYLYRAVRRNARTRAKRRRPDRNALPLHMLAADDTRPGPGVDPMELEEAIDLLPVSQQMVIRLRFYAGMTFREIGHTVSISTHTAASRCRYALEKLNRWFSE